MKQPLVLSVFAGIGMLDMAFEEEGFCVVRGPDQLWGGDIRRFHPPADVFDGVIGGPPCQGFSRLVHIIRAKGQTPAENLIPDFERCVAEALPRWFIMENVPDAPEPRCPGYYPVQSIKMDNHWFGGEQGRIRRISFGCYHAERIAVLGRLDFSPSLAVLEHPNRERAVVATSSKEGALAKSQQELRDGTSRRLQREAGVLPGQKPRRIIERCCELQGLPPDFTANMPFTMAGKYKVIGNGVPLPMGRAIAKAVKRAMGYEAAA